MVSNAIPTRYKGIQFRSRLEAKWAAFFDLLGWRWEYEPSTPFSQWIPDFVLLPHEGSRVYVEVKPKKQFLEAIEKVERSSCEEPVLVLADGPDGFHASVGRYFLGWYFQKGETSRAIVTICSPRGHHFCDPALDRPHHVCDEVDQPKVMRRTRRSIDSFWREAGNRVQWKPPLPFRRRRIGTGPSGHCWTLSRTKKEPGGSHEEPARRRTRVKRWLSLGTGGLVAVAAVVVAVLLLSGRGEQEPVPALSVATEPASETAVPASATPASTSPAVVDRDCADFESWPEAQAFYEEAGGPEADPHSLDPDQDGVACERLRGAEAATPEEPVADRDCGDFATWDAAQAFYEQAGGPEADPHRLDPDEDGVACEALREGDGQ